MIAGAKQEAKLGKRGNARRELLLFLLWLLPEWTGGEKRKGGRVWVVWMGRFWTRFYVQDGVSDVMMERDERPRQKAMEKGRRRQRATAGAHTTKKTNERDFSMHAYSGSCAAGWWHAHRRLQRL